MKRETARKADRILTESKVKEFAFIEADQSQN